MEMRPATNTAVIRTTADCEVLTGTVVGVSAAGEDWGEVDGENDGEADGVGNAVGVSFSVGRVSWDDTDGITERVTSGDPDVNLMSMVS